MIICMSEILCVTNRKLCQEDFFLRLEKIAAARPAGVILREKDLSESEYKRLAARVQEICQAQGIPCILHCFADAAAELGAEAIHLPLPVLRGMTAQQKARFLIIGASCHSVTDAVEAERLGCSYLTAGHIFDTDCKRGLPGRGVEFLKAVCGSVSIPVYAIGGIAPENIGEIIGAGAKGGCVMSGLMRCENPAEYLRKLVEPNAIP